MSFWRTALDYLGWGNDSEVEQEDYPPEDREELAGHPRELGERRESGVIPLRHERQEFAGSSHPPPRTTRIEPVFGPVGSREGEDR